MQRARFARAGLLAIEQKAWGVEVDERPVGADRGFVEVGNAAVVTIRGPLLSRGEGFLSLFCDSYDAIAARVGAAFASAAKRVILRIDSPGGDAAGCLELSRQLRGMARAADGKSFLAFAEGAHCASAAFAIACAADEIVVTPTCYVGSVGVFEALCDVSTARALQGIRIVVVSSGEAKTDRNPDVPITDEAVSRVQAQVDEFAGLFWQLVADMRGGAPDDYRALSGGVFLGASALGVGLADRVGVWSDVLAGFPGAGEKATMAGNKHFGSAKESLRAVVDDEKADPAERDKARKSLRALEDEPKKDDDDKKKDDDAKAQASEEEAAKAKAAEDEKARATAAAAQEEQAKALAAGNSLALAREVQELKAQASARDAAEAKAKEAAARTELFAKRPDFSDAVKATLSLVPLADLEKAVKDWPRANAGPGAAAAALTAAGGERPSRSTYVPHLTADEQAILAKLDGGPAGPKAAVTRGTMFQMPARLTQAEAAARLAELEKENV